MYPILMKGNWSLLTHTRSDLQTLGCQPIIPKIVLYRCYAIPCLIQMAG